MHDSGLRQRQAEMALAFDVFAMSSDPSMTHNNHLFDASGNCSPIHE
jgi:hypothetical protein